MCKIKIKTYNLETNWIFPRGNKNFFSIPTKNNSHMYVIKPVREGIGKACIRMSRLHKKIETNSRAYQITECIIVFIDDDFSHPRNSLYH